MILRLRKGVAWSVPLGVLLVSGSLSCSPPADTNPAQGGANPAEGGASLAEGGANTQGTPVFQVDPLWPKPLPNNWIVGAVIGAAVDATDNIWMLHRASTLDDSEKAASFNPPRALCCVPAPPVLVFDQAGNLLRSWGGPGPGYEWPIGEHGITVDYKGNIWIAGNDAKDAQILKFTPDGKFLLQIGHQGKSGGSNDTENLGRAAEVFVDATTNEAFVADGYGNRRVIVYDADTGAYKRHWGAYGSRPDDTPLPAYDDTAPPAKQFRGPVHCIVISKDDLLYVCDRSNNRIQLFRKDGTFVKEAVILPKTRSTGVFCDVAFSTDAAQKYMYVADCANSQVHILLRDSLQMVSSFGGGGRGPGQFVMPHSMTADSKGNLYTGECCAGRRMQRFVFKGPGPA